MPLSNFHWNERSPVSVYRSLYTSMSSVLCFALKNKESEKHADEICTDQPQIGSTPPVVGKGESDLKSVQLSPIMGPA